MNADGSGKLRLARNVMDNPPPLRPGRRRAEGRLRELARPGGWSFARLGIAVVNADGSEEQR